MTARAAALVLVLLAAPAFGEEPEAAPEPAPVAGAIWCRVIHGSGTPDPAPDAEAPAPDASPGCDAGVAAALHRFRRWPRLSIVGALGTKTLGGGLGWTFYRDPRGRAYGVALGAVAQWGSAGIDISDVGLAAGVTMTLAKRGKSDSP